MFLGILVAVSVGMWLYPRLPEKMASHWNLAGEINGYVSKFWGVVLMPLVAGGLWGLFEVIPLIDPLKKNIAKFRKEYNLLVAVIVLGLLVIYGLALGWNLGWRFDWGRVMAVVFGGLFWLIGTILPKTKRNWFLGFRTPWTLSSDRVWEKTHQQGGKIFKAVGLIALVGVLLPKLAFYLVIAPAVGGSIWLVWFSYREYEKESVK